MEAEMVAAAASGKIAVQHHLNFAAEAASSSFACQMDFAAYGAAETVPRVFAAGPAGHSLSNAALWHRGRECPAARPACLASA
jgi:hypothetical protein